MRARLRDPVFWTHATQLLKTVAAAVIAWVLAVHVFHIEQAFLAPWAALLTVHATVYRTFRRGAQQVGATVLGVLLAFAVGALLGLNALSLGDHALPRPARRLGQGRCGRSRRRRPRPRSSCSPPATATTAACSSRGCWTRPSASRVGVLVNLLVWPPLRDRGAAAQVDAIDDRLGALLCDMAAALREGCPPETADEWIARSRELDEEIEQAWGVVRQARESGRLNPRRGTHERMRAAAAFDAILERLEQAVSETQSMARTIRLERVPPAEWDPAFREPWLELLERTGAAVAAADVEALHAVAEDVESWRPEGLWPVSGALLVNLRNILDGFDEVADAQPVHVPAPALTATLELAPEAGQQLAHAQRAAGARRERRRVEPGRLAHPLEQLGQRLERREARLPAELRRARGGCPSAARPAPCRASPAASG